MKFAFLAAALLGIFPLAITLRRFPQLFAYVWTLVGFLVFLSTIVRSQVSLLAWEDWLGYVRSADISLLDILLLGVWISADTKPNPLFPHSAFRLFLFACLFSVTQAAEPVAALFGVLQFCRIYLVAVIVARFSVHDAVVLDILKGMALGLALEAVVVMQQKFIGGVVQPSGTMIHQNLLGFLGHFVIYPNFILLLCGRKDLQAIIAPVAGGLIAVLSASRGAMAFSALGLALTFAASLAGRASGRKLAVGALGVLGAAVLVPLALNSIHARVAAGENPFQQGSDYDDRDAHDAAADLMIADHPFGVGMNHYVFNAYNDGYAFRGGVLPFDENLQTHVHDAFRLTLVELGYLGLIAFIVLIGSIMLIAVREGFMSRNNIRGEMLLAFSVTMTMISIHSFFEWIIVGIEAQYMLALTVGMICGLAETCRRKREGRFAAR